MAIRLFSLSRSIFTSKQAVISFLSRSSTGTSTSLPVPQLSAIRYRPLAAVTHFLHGASPASLGSLRTFSTRHTQSSLNDSSPNWSNRPPKETILLDGCDFEHWLVVMEKPDESMTRDQIIDMYIKTLAQVVGSEEEARMKIYSVSTRHYFAFGALVDEEKSYLIKELPKVRWVLPDSYLDVKNKNYGGEPFINGEAVPYDPKYHEEWVRNNAKAMERNRRNDRPRNFDRSRNFDRRQNSMPNPGPPQPPQNRMPSTPPPHNIHPMQPSNNMGPPPPQPPPNMGPSGYSGRPSTPNSGWQGHPQNFQGNGYSPNSQGPPPPSNYQNYGQPGNSLRSPPPGGSPGYPQNPQGPPPGDNRGYPQNLQGPPPGGYPGHSQGPPPSNYQNYGPPGNNFRDWPPPGGNPYQEQGDMPAPPPSPPRNY